MTSLNINIKEGSLTFVVFVMSSTFLFGPALEIVPSQITFLFRLIYLTILIVFVLLFNNVRNIHLFFLFLMSFFMLFKYESSIFFNYVTIIVLCMYLRSHQIGAVISKSFTSVCVLSALHLFLYKTGVVVDSIDANYIGRSRTSMGFSNPNQLAIFYFSVFIVSYSKLIILKELSNKKLFLPLMIIFYSIYIIIVSDSRTSLLGCIIVVLSHLIIKGELLKIVILRFTVVMLVLLTILIALLHETFLNSVLSFRPILFYNELVRMAGIGFFLGLYEIKQVDNLVIILISSIGFPIFVVLWIWTIYSIKKIDMKFFPLVIATLSMSIFEAFLLRPELPITILFLSIIINSSGEVLPHKK